MHNHFFCENRLFTYRSPAVRNPLNFDAYLPAPAGATQIPPPPFGDNQNARFRDDGSGWDVVPDWRGTKYWIDDVAHEITEAGVELPEGAVLEKPESVIAQELAAALAANKLAHVAWLNGKHSELVRDLLGNPTDDDITGWTRNLSLAQQYLTGNAAQSVVDAITAKLKTSEAAMPNALRYWSLLVTVVKAPMAEYVYDLAEGIKRRGEENMAVVLSGDISDPSTVFDNLRQISTSEAFGENYEPAKTREENAAQGTLGGAVAMALQKLGTLKAQFAAQLTAGA